MDSLRFKKPCGCRNAIQLNTVQRSNRPSRLRGSFNVNEVILCACESFGLCVAWWLGSLTRMLIHAASFHGIYLVLSVATATFECILSCAAFLWFFVTFFCIFSLYTLYMPSNCCSACGSSNKNYTCMRCTVVRITDAYRLEGLSLLWF